MTVWDQNSGGLTFDVCKRSYAVAQKVHFLSRRFHSEVGFAFNFLFPPPSHLKDNENMTRCFYVWLPSKVGFPVLPFDGSSSAERLNALIFLLCLGGGGTRPTGVRQKLLCVLRKPSTGIFITHLAHGTPPSDIPPRAEPGRPP